MEIEKHRATGSINVTQYEPKPYGETYGITLSEVQAVEAFTGGLTGNGAARSLHVQLRDGTAHFTGVERFSGALEGRSGSFLFRIAGVLRDGAITSDWLILPGTGTGELAGLNGTGSAGPSGYSLEFWFD